MSDPFLRLGKLTRNNLFKRLLSIWPFFRKEVVLNEVKWFSMWVLLVSLQALILIGYIVYTLRSNDAILIGLVVMVFRYQTHLSDVFFNFSANYSEIVRMNTDVLGVQPILDDIKRLSHHPRETVLARR